MTWDEHIRAEGASMRWTFAEPRIRELNAKVTALEADNGRLREAVLDADHLCKWLLQSNISGCDRERVIREYGITFALLAAARAQQPYPAQDKEQA